MGRVLDVTVHIKARVSDFMMPFVHAFDAVRMKIVGGLVYVKGKIDGAVLNVQLNLAHTYGAAKANTLHAYSTHVQPYAEKVLDAYGKTQSRMMAICDDAADTARTAAKDPTTRAT